MFRCDLEWDLHRVLSGTLKAMACSFVPMMNGIMDHDRDVEDCEDKGDKPVLTLYPFW